MHSLKKKTIWINVIAGVAVLLSYLPATGMGDALWGGLPESLRPVYTVSMILATIGYFLFSSYLVLRMDPDRDRVFGGASVSLVPWLYLAAIGPSAIWLPLTQRWLAEPSDFLWALIRLDLAVVGVASVALLLTVATLRPARSGRGWAIFGCACFAFQTAVLDALVWPALFLLP